VAVALAWTAPGPGRVKGKGASANCKGAGW
jgi:hypothetical protein